MSFATTFGLSFSMGAALVGLSLFLGWVAVTYKFNETAMKWLLLPTLGYGLAVALNSGVQNVFCNKTSIKQIATGGTVVPVAILIFLLLSTFGIVRAPVEQAVPLAYRIQYGQSMALAFYMFWAGMFGEALAGGFAQACPAS
jgi:hypothetical protein